MSTKTERWSSILISSDLLGRESSQPSCRILYMPVEQSSHFSPLEARFFKEGDDIATGPVATDNFDDPTGVVRLHHRVGRSVPLIAAAVALALVFTAVSCWRAFRHDQPTESAKAAQPVAISPAPVLAVTEPPASPTAQAPEPAAIPVAAPVALPATVALPDKLHEEAPAPAPAAARPSSPQAAAGAVAASGGNDTFEACRRAYDQRRAKDVLSICAEAFATAPPSAEVAVMLAKTEFDRGRPRQALDWAKRAVAIDVDHADAYVFLGGAEQAAGHSAAARTAYKRYLQLAPQGRYAADLRAVLASL